jgi:hypothetical protein
MPRFLDAHSMKDFDELTLQEAQNSPIDEFGVKHLNILYNSEADCPVAGSGLSLAQTLVIVLFIIISCLTSVL